MVLGAKLYRLFFGFEDAPEVMRAKVRALQRHVPLLYTILLVNVAFVSITHFKSTPLFLSVIAPAVVGIFALLRAIGWLKLDPEKLSDDEIRARLKSTIMLVPALGAVFTIWALTLFVYGGPYEKAHVTLFIALTSAACMLCLLHLRAAALHLALIVTIPFGLMLLQSPQLASKLMAVNVAVALGAMVVVLSRQNRLFIDTIRQKIELQQKQGETQRLSDENFRLATRDGLTGLPNRRSFLSDFSQSLREATKENMSLALLLLDLDGFKAINDIYGHAAGDTLLVKVASRLRDAMLKDVYCARLSGDEFAIALRGFADEPEMLARAQKLVDILSQPYSISQTEVTISASIGIAVFGVTARTAQDLFEQADYALYHAKETNRTSPMVFDATLERRVALLHELDHIFRSGQIEQELSLAYQPIVRTGSLDVTGYEALARWNNERLGHLTAGEFMESAGRSGMASKFTQVLFRKLLADIPKLPTDATISFNLSARDLVDPKSILGIVSDVQQSGIVARRLQFEVSETAVAADFDKVLRSLTLLRNLGCTISLNNFGSGQSVLGYIYRLPIDTVKIDVSFIRECQQNPAARETLKAIIKLCDTLDLTSTAVGIETEELANMAESLGCMRIQGYFVSWPLPLDVILKDQKRANAG